MQDRNCLPVFGLYPGDDRRRRDQSAVFLPCADEPYRRGVRSRSRFPEGRQQGAGVRDLEAEKGSLLRHPDGAGLWPMLIGWFLCGCCGFPVIDDGRCLGIITLKEVREAPREYWHCVTVGSVFVTHDRKGKVSTEDGVMRAPELIIREDKGRLGIIESNKLSGPITRNGIAR
jgi:hypothetical protein